LVEPVARHPPVAGDADGVPALPDGAFVDVGIKGLEANGAIRHEAVVGRVVPRDWHDRQRREFLQIASRAKAEVCASYALVAIGVQAFCFNSSADTLRNDE
jgi:hypothetical protein